MTSTKETLPSYAGSCNPPRRAKRARTDAAETTGATSPEQPVNTRNASRRGRPLILPKERAPGTDPSAGEAVDSESAEEEDYDPSLRSNAPKRRGRKPGSLSRSARESLRKLNHSRIEKARRTKINETLATLSTLVNAREGGPIDGEDEPDPHVKQAGKGKTEEKEFKLDVLVKTVAYMQELIEKVKILDAGGCPNCSRDREASPSPAPSLKRKRPADDVEECSAVEPPQSETTTTHEDYGDDTYTGDDENGDTEDVDSIQRSPVLEVISARISTSPRLPPIASWLPHPYIDPSCIAALSRSKAAPPSSQLPSPPPSGRFRASSAAGNVPALTLPGPAQPIAATKPVQSVKSGVIASSARIAIPRNDIASRSDHGDTNTRRASISSRSPTWTPEDETAASLLLQMSSSPSISASTSVTSSAVSALTLPKAVDSSGTSSGKSAVKGSKPKMSPALQAETPSSLLGLMNGE